MEKNKHFGTASPEARTKLKGESFKKSCHAEHQILLNQEMGYC